MKSTTIFTLFIILLYSITASAQCTVSITSSTNVSCFGGNDGSATALADNGTPLYTYLWSNTQTTTTATGLLAGVHCVTITDNIGCTATTCVNILQPATAVSVGISSTTNVHCHGENSGSATALVTGGTPAYLFVWSDGLTTTANINPNLNAGTHCVTVTDANNCSATTCTNIIEPTLLTVTANVTSNYNGADISCFGASDGQMTATASGGTGIANYTWSNGQNTAVVTEEAGTYCVTATDVNGCTASDCVTLTEPSQLSVSIPNTTNVSCSGAADGEAGAIGIGGTAGIFYIWPTGATGAFVTDLYASTSYCITATDGNGCAASDCVTLTQPDPVLATITNVTNISCFGNTDGAATVAASGGIGGYSYIWYKNGIPIAPIVTTPTITGLGVGVYVAMVTDLNGCVASSATVTITEPNPLTMSISGPDTVCSGSIVTITAIVNGGSGPYNYIWSNLTPQPAVVGPLSGTYCVTVTDINGCTTTDCKTIIPINFETTIQDNWTGENPHIFMGDSYNIQSTSIHPVVSYNWTPAAGLSCTTCPDPIAAPAVTTTYHLTTLNTSGCVEEDSITIEVFTPTTSYVYIDVAPDSTVLYNYTPSALWTNGSMFNMAILLPPTLNYGVATLDTNIHQVQYVSNGTAPEVTDTIMYLICNQICDTMYFYITTASCVWAGDTDDDGIANNMDLLPIGLHHSATGSTRYNASTDYICQPSRNWNTGTLGNPTVDIKHIDCDGNGTINDIDTNAIVLNWAQTHLKNISTTTTGVEIYIDTLTAMPGNTVSLPIILGDALNPSSGYGIAFTINYDVMGVDTNSVSIDFSNSWLGTIGNNMIGISKDFYNAGMVEVAMTRTDHNSVMGGGIIGYIDLTIKDDVLPKSAFLRLDFEISDVRFIDNLGDTIPTLPLPSQILVVDNWLSHSTIKKDNKISVFPNPTGSLLNIQSLNENIEMVQVLDLTGKIVLEQSSIHSLQNVLDMNMLSAGVYVLTVQTGSGVEMVRVIKN